MERGKAKIGVIGAGLMGAEIALVHALAGYDVRLVDREDALLAKAVDRLSVLYDKGVQRSFYQAADKEQVFARIATSSDRESLADRDVVTEAVFEKEDVKAEVLGALDRICGPDCILATNTSTMPITVLASHVGEARRPRFVGTHYFSPVSRMKLVEIIPALETASETVETVTEFARAVGKTPIRIKDVAGFAVNRLLHALVIEALRLVEEEVASPEDIDLACRLGLGHPMGPFELMDATTSSLCLQVQEILHDNYGERFMPRPILRQRVQAGYVGGKGRKGWRS